ncbi:hypothetical protein X798_00625 [Onchocerca flexuosa]|uniref:Uncharacterized protein n=2 Tax=Onchocerca flexuosa TaxID=387005 RepID=A0A183H2G9_9BILA|nr:hypothetical protein X798_00625 [Onchocerca flexuosa]VDO30405.1 unnamed protein product [Onchocerca flexuosa]
MLALYFSVLTHLRFYIMDKGLIHKIFPKIHNAVEDQWFRAARRGSTPGGVLPPISLNFGCNHIFLKTEEIFASEKLTVKAYSPPTER